MDLGRVTAAKNESVVPLIFTGTLGREKVMNLRKMGILGDIHSLTMATHEAGRLAGPYSLVTLARYRKQTITNVTPLRKAYQDTSI